jgi:histidinol-phosphate/aromatic aminotransferase/cobyric acid decarboxylase-like protein
MYSSVRKTCPLILSDWGPERIWLVRLWAMLSNVLAMSPSFAEYTTSAMAAGGRPKNVVLTAPFYRIAFIACLDM